MEAPKKIYLHPSDRAGEDYDDDWGTIPCGENCVEYTRTDVFIKKACEWLRTHSEVDYFELIHVGNYCGAGTVNKKKFIEDFKKYMEEK